MKLKKGERLINPNIKVSLKRILIEWLATNGDIKGHQHKEAIAFLRELQSFKAIKLIGKIKDN